EGCGCFEGPPTDWYPDVDGDGLGAGQPQFGCVHDVPVASVSNNLDAEPDCATNDATERGVCGARGCDDVCGSGAALDACLRCAGGTTGVEPADPTDSDGDGVPDACLGPDLIVDAAN